VNATHNLMVNNLGCMVHSHVKKKRISGVIYPHTAMGMRILSLSERSDTCPSIWPDMKHFCLKGPLDSHVDPFVPGIDDRTV
jgi:hypothetical protein